MYATQNPELRKKFKGKPEHVVNYMYFVAQELREIMAKLGFRTVDEMVGQVHKLDRKKAVDHYKASGIDLSPILYQVEVQKEPSFIIQRNKNIILKILLNFKL